MDELKHELEELNTNISDLLNQIQEAKTEAENNIKPLNNELSQIKDDKRVYASRNDFDSVQECNRKENNLKFKINAQWNKYSILKEDLTRLKNKKTELEAQIKLEEDKIKRTNEIISQMDRVLKNYKKTGNLKQASIDSNINPNQTQQWLEWGENGFNDSSTYFYNQIQEIDDYFKQLEADKLKHEMDNVIEAYRKTKSLKEASKLANVSHDTVQYWYEWGSRGFGEENTYFYKKIKD